MNKSWTNVLRILEQGGTIWAPARADRAFVCDLENATWRRMPSTVRTSTLDAMVEAGLLDMELGGPSSPNEDRHWYVRTLAQGNH
jgi:hypothetical protein